MRKTPFRLRAERWLGVLLGVILVAGALRTVVLHLVGETAPAVVTLVRREGGQRSDVQAGRYTYVLSYTFKLPDGRSVDGFAKTIGDGAYVRRPNTATTVRYLPYFPAVNALESQTAINLTQVILIAVGVVLIWPLGRRGSYGR
jgi:hypothetical protein